MYLIMWICVFNEPDTRFWLRQDTGTMNRPLRLTECSHPISWVYVECFAECSPRIRNPFEMSSRNVRNVFVICVLHIRRAKVWFLRHKSMVFSVQKPPFYIAKRGFLFFVIMVDAFADAGKRFYFAGVVGCVIVTSMQLFWSIRLRRVVRMSSQVIFSTM